MEQKISPGRIVNFLKGVGTGGVPNDIRAATCACVRNSSQCVGLWVLPIIGADEEVAPYFVDYAPFDPTAQMKGSWHWPVKQ